MLISHTNAVHSLHQSSFHSHNKGEEKKKIELFQLGFYQKIDRKQCLGDKMLRIINNLILANESFLVMKSIV